MTILRNRLLKKLGQKRKMMKEPRTNRGTSKTMTGSNAASCKSWVSSSREACGVNHRNHCPFCLVSLHVDQTRAGDRRSACRSRMVAIGLTFKKVSKRYPGEGQGELMLIHRCTGCGKISINRIAADDNPEATLCPGQVLCGTARAFPEQLVRDGHPRPGRKRIRRCLRPDLRAAADRGGDANDEICRIGSLTVAAGGSPRCDLLFAW